MPTDADLPTFVPDDRFIAAVRQGVTAHRRRSRRRAASALALVAVLAGSGVWYANDQLSSIRRIDIGTRQPSQPDPLVDDTPFNLLVVGTDGCGPSLEGTSVCIGRAPDEHLADAISVLHVDPAAHTIDLLSIPRDLWLVDRQTKINSLPADELTTVLDQRFGLPIAHYGAIDMGGVNDIATAVGLRLDPGRAIRDRSTGLDLQPGCQVVSGPQVLALVRSRHLEALDDKDTWVKDPTGDLGRIERRTSVITAALSELGGSDPSISMITDITRIMVTSGVVDDALSNADLIRLGRLLASSTMRSTSVLPTFGSGSKGMSFLELGDAAAVNAALAPLGGRYDGPASTTPPPSAPIAPAGDTTIGWDDLAPC